MSSLVKIHACNAEACVEANLPHQLLDYVSTYVLILPSAVSKSVLRKILQLIHCIFQHSVTIPDVQALFKVFRSPAFHEHDIDDDKMALYVATLELIARSSFGPSSYFDLTGVNSGIAVPVLDTFSSVGYSFCCWIRLESFGAQLQPLFAFWYVRYCRVGT